MLTPRLAAGVGAKCETPGLQSEVEMRKCLTRSLKRHIKHRLKHHLERHFKQHLKGMGGG